MKNENPQKSIADFLHSVLYSLGLAKVSSFDMDSARIVHVGYEDGTSKDVFRIRPNGSTVNMLAVRLGKQTVLPQKTVATSDRETLNERCKAIAKAFRDYAPVEAERNFQSIKVQTIRLLWQLNSVKVTERLLNELVDDNRRGLRRAYEKALKQC